MSCIRLYNLRKYFQVKHGPGFLSQRDTNKETCFYIVGLGHMDRVIDVLSTARYGEQSITTWDEDNEIVE